MKATVRCVLLALVVSATGCVTNMRVRTEVYKGDLPADDVPANAGKAAAIVDTALSNYGTRAVDVAATNYVSVIARLQTEYPEFFGTAESLPAFRESFELAGREALDPALRSAATARTLAGQLQKAACPLGQSTNESGPCATSTPSDAMIQQWLVALRQQLMETARLGRTAIARMDSEEIAQYRSLLQGNFLKTMTDKKTGKKTFTNDKTLVRLTGRKQIKDDVDRRDAIAEVMAQADVITRNLRAEDDALLESLLVSEPLSAGQLLVTTEIVPLFDPAIPLILAESEANPTVWKKFVNDVESHNQFGNAEIAFRMDGLGDSHIKGVLFDSSQAMKTGFSVLAKTVEATATAFGGAAFAPLTRTEQTRTSTTGVADTSTTTTTAATTPLTSKPAIDAEVSRLTSAASMRRDTMESLFWNVTAIANDLPAAGEGAAAAAKKLIALLKCAQDEIADPKGRRCGGES